MKIIRVLLFALIPVASCMSVHANKVKIKNNQDESVWVIQYHEHGAKLLKLNGPNDARISANSVKNIDLDIQFLFIKANGSVYKITLPSSSNRTTIIVKERDRDSKENEKIIKIERNPKNVSIQEVEPTTSLMVDEFFSGAFDRWRAPNPTIGTD